MLRTYDQPRRRNTYLEEYALRLGSVSQHYQARIALTHAREQAEEAAYLARVAMLKAQAADRLKSEFLASMSHELRTPLNAIIGFSDLMTSHFLAPVPVEKCRTYARYIHEAGTHLLSIVNDILDLAKIEAGKTELDESWLDIAAEIDACIALTLEPASQAAIAMKRLISADLPNVLADRRKIRQAIINLLGNAVKFTPDGGTVSIEVDSKAEGLLIVIQDTGIGIPPEQLNHVLQPFGQVEGALTRRHGGTGLGLPIARALIELHGGQLSLSSTLGAGTRVVIRIPPARLRARLPSRAVSPANWTLNGRAQDDGDRADAGPAIDRTGDWQSRVPCGSAGHCPAR